jgi:hypothetical protein
MKPGKPGGIFCEPGARVQNPTISKMWASSTAQIHEFAAAQQPVFFPVEEDDHSRADGILFKEPRAFQADGDGAGVVVGSRSARYGIVMRTEQEMRPAVGTAGSHDDVVVAPLKSRRISEIAEECKQKIPGAVVGLSFRQIMARESEHINEREESLRRYAAQHVGDLGVRRVRPAIL